MPNRRAFSLLGAILAALWVMAPAKANDAIYVTGKYFAVCDDYNEEGDHLAGAGSLELFPANGHYSAVTITQSSIVVRAKAPTPPFEVSTIPVIPQMLEGPRTIDGEYALNPNGNDPRFGTITADFDNDEVEDDVANFTVVETRGHVATKIAVAIPCDMSGWNLPVFLVNAVFSR